MKKAFIIVLILLILASASGISYIQYQKYSTQQAITDLRKDPTYIETSTVEPKEFPFAEIKDKNPDFSGWLLIDGTTIDLPIMQNMTDPDFYLDHNFQNETDPNGLPFLDERNATDFSDEVTIVYGHNMKNGLIFHDLELYRDLSYFLEHNIITIYSESGTKVYRVLAYIEEKIASTNSFTYNFYTSFDTEEERGEFLDTLLEHSVHPVELPMQASSLLILSTCDNITLDGRIALLAYEITV